MSTRVRRYQNVDCCTMIEPVRGRDWDYSVKSGRVLSPGPSHCLVFPSAILQFVFSTLRPPGWLRSLNIHSTVLTREQSPFQQFGTSTAALRSDEHSSHIYSHLFRWAFTAWSLYKHYSDVDIIFQLLLVKHRHAHLPMFSRDEVDIMIEFLCTK